MLLSHLALKHIMISIILKITYSIFLIQSFHQHLCGEQHVFHLLLHCYALASQSCKQRNTQHHQATSFKSLHLPQNILVPLHKRKYTRNYQNPAHFPFFICNTGKEGINCEANINADVDGKNSQEHTGPHLFTQVDKVSAFKVLWQLFLQLFK